MQQMEHVGYFSMDLSKKHQDFFLVPRNYKNEIIGWAIINRYHLQKMQTGRILFMYLKIFSIIL